MINRKLDKYLINPSLGIIISIFYIVLLAVSSNVELSILASMGFAAIGDIILRYITKSRINSLLLAISFLALSVNLTLWLIIKDNQTAFNINIAFFEIFMVVLLTLAHLSKTYITLYIGKKINTLQKTMLSEFFDIARILQYIFTFHIFIILIYKQINTYGSDGSLIESLIIFGIPITLLSALYIFQRIKVHALVRKLNKEEWLPIVNESGEVTGRIAKSVSARMKNRFMHPIVRIALVHDGQLYLQPRSELYLLNPGLYDHPFEKYMQFNHDINQSVRNCITEKIQDVELQSSFLIKYVFENENTKRLIFLFVSRIDDETFGEISQKLSGKFWTSKQIEENMSDKDSIFSECFDLEYEYIKNTVLFADMIRKDMTKQDI